MCEYCQLFNSLSKTINNKQKNEKETKINKEFVEQNIIISNNRNDLPLKENNL